MIELKFSMVKLLRSSIVAAAGVLLLSATAMAQTNSLPSRTGPAIQIDKPVPAPRIPRPGAGGPMVAPKQMVARRAMMESQKSVRIKDITSIADHRTNRLEGMGLVVGLNGTGGRSESTINATRNAMLKYDMNSVPATGSTSLVYVSAELPAFAQPGETIQATVSVVDDATGLFGGILTDTELRGADGEVYCVSGGSLISDGLSASGAASSVSKNHDTTAKVDAMVEVAVSQGPAFPDAKFRLLLKNKDYATANNIAKKINEQFPNSAFARDQGSVDVFFPKRYLNSKIQFVVYVNALRVVPDIPARVVINQKTGTILIGQNVRISTTVVSHGNLIVTTNETPLVSQPAPLSDGQTIVVPQTQLTATETGGKFNVLQQQTTVGDLAAALNLLGASPHDVISIFRDIEAQGHIQGSLIVR